MSSFGRLAYWLSWADVKSCGAAAQYTDLSTKESLKSRRSRDSLAHDESARSHEESIDTNDSLQLVIDSL